MAKEVMGKKMGATIERDKNKKLSAKKVEKKEDRYEDKKAKKK